jgi:hypothetical protein
MGSESSMSYSYSAWHEPFGVAETPAEYVIHRPRLYLETTIPSYLTARTSRDLTKARHQHITAQWWNSWRTQFDIYVSVHVLTEAEDGDEDAARRRLDLIAPYVVLVPDDRSRKLATLLMENCGLPKRAEADAKHVAVAAVHSMDFLLTWNCAHLANEQFASKIALTCKAEGYICPTLCTPDQLIERYEHGLHG